MAFDYQSFKNEFPYFKSPNAVVIWIMRRQH